MRDSVNTIVEKEDNPFREFWKNYLAGVITNKELLKILGKWQLARVQKYKYQQIPLMPKGKKSLPGWLVACNKIKYENISHRYWLKILLDKIDEEIVEAEQGKIEEIGELLGEYPRKSKTGGKL